MTSKGSNHPQGQSLGLIMWQSEFESVLNTTLESEPYKDRESMYVSMDVTGESEYNMTLVTDKNKANPETDEKKRGK